MKEQDVRKVAEAEPTTTGGDVEADRYQAQVTGEEAVGGQTPTPGQNDVDKLGSSAGIEMADTEPLPVTEKLAARDGDRWELDANSAEDH
ncbi:MAG: DUF6335 family protein [Cyanophyceae cyanobacterium]